MKLTSNIKITACFALSSGILTALLLWLSDINGGFGLWEIAIVAAYVPVVMLLAIFFLRRFLLQQFDSLMLMVNNKRLTKEERAILLHGNDVLSAIRKLLLEWSRTKAVEIGQLKQMEKYRREFLGNVSHELKTPIFNIQGYILTLLDGGLEDETINRLYLERSDKSISRMIHIVEDLESISRLESGELKLDPEPFEMRRMVEEIFEMLEMEAAEAKVKLAVEKRTAWVDADRKRINEVMTNLVTNSIKYGRKNGTTSITFTDKNKHWLIAVADDGIGISESDQLRIFERFYRCDKSRSREQGGTGLGLSIVKHIVEAHGQTIHVTSEPGKGSVFSFKLPKRNGEK